MKKYPLFLAALFLAPVMFLFTACGDTTEDLSNTTLTIEYSETVYTGQAKTPSITVTKHNQIIDIDNYSCTYTNNLNAGIATVKITGQNALHGFATMHFSILPRVLNTSNVQEVYSTPYNGSEYAPIPVVFENNIRLIAGQDYEYSYSNNVNSGIGALTLNGINNYTGKITKTFFISPKPLTSLMVNSLSNYTYNGNAIEPQITVKDGFKTLIRDVDYTVAYRNNVSTGVASAIITGKNNYTDTITKSFNIVKKSLSVSMITGLGEYEYTGSAIVPEITLHDGNILLTKDVDYTISLGTNNINPGNVAVVITGINNYNGYIETAYTIAKFDFAALEISPISALSYTGTAHTPDIIVKLNQEIFPSDNYNISYANNLNAGAATVTVTPKADSAIYTGSQVANFTINPLPCGEYTSIVQPIGVTFNFTSQPPAITVNLKNGGALVNDEDYTVAYTRGAVATKDFTSSGIVKVTVTFTKNYSGSDYFLYLISKVTLDDSMLNIRENIIYNGRAQTPVTLSYLNNTLYKGVDYEITYSNNLEPGEAQFTITAKENSNFIGTLTGTFTINPNE